MVAFTTSRPSAALIPVQRLDHLQAPAKVPIFPAGIVIRLPAAHVSFCRILHGLALDKAGVTPGAVDFLLALILLWGLAVATARGAQWQAPMPTNLGDVYHSVWADVLGLPTGLNCPQVGGLSDYICGGVSPLVDAANNTPDKASCVAPYNQLADSSSQKATQTTPSFRSTVGWTLGGGIGGASGGWLGSLLGAFGGFVGNNFEPFSYMVQSADVRQTGLNFCYSNFPSVRHF